MTLYILKLVTNDFKNENSSRKTTDNGPDRLPQEHTGGGQVSKKLRFLSG